MSPSADDPIDLQGQLDAALAALAAMTKDRDNALALAATLDAQRAEAVNTNLAAAATVSAVQDDVARQIRSMNDAKDAAVAAAVAQALADAKVASDKAIAAALAEPKALRDLRVKQAADSSALADQQKAERAALAEELLK